MSLEVAPDVAATKLAAKPLEERDDGTNAYSFVDHLISCSVRSGNEARMSRMV
jgi:hypothetical protein